MLLRRFAGLFRRNARLSFATLSLGVRMGPDAFPIFNKASLAFAVFERRSGSLGLGASCLCRGQHSERGEEKQFLGHQILQFGAANRLLIANTKLRFGSKADFGWSSRKRQL